MVPNQPFEPFPVKEIMRNTLEDLAEAIPNLFEPDQTVAEIEDEPPRRLKGAVRKRPR